MEENFYLPKLLSENIEEGMMMVQALQYHIQYLKKQHTFFIIEQYLMTHPEVENFTIFLSKIGIKDKYSSELDIQIKMKEGYELTKEGHDLKQDSIYNLLYQFWEIYPENLYQDILNVDICLNNLDNVKALLLQNNSFDGINNVNFSSQNLETIILPKSIQSQKEFQELDLESIQNKIDFLIQQELILTLQQFFSDNIVYDIPDLKFKISHYQHFEIEYPEELPFARTLDGIELNNAIQKISHKSSIVFQSLLPIHNQLINHTNFAEKISLMLGEEKAILLEKLNLDNSISSSYEHNRNKMKI